MATVLQRLVKMILTDQTNNKELLTHNSATRIRLLLGYNIIMGYIGVNVPVTDGQPV